MEVMLYKVSIHRIADRGSMRSSYWRFDLLASMETNIMPELKVARLTFLTQSDVKVVILLCFRHLAYHTDYVRHVYCTVLLFSPVLRTPASLLVTSICLHTLKLVPLFDRNGQIAAYRGRFSSRSRQFKS